MNTKKLRSPVAFAVQTPAGVSPLGWMDYKLYDAAKQLAELRPGCYYIFAYASTPDDMIERASVPYEVGSWGDCRGNGP